MLKKVFILTLLLQGVASMGQTGIAVRFPASGDFLVFTSHGRPTEPPSAPTASKGGPVTVTPAGQDDTVSVWDKSSGNMGSRPVSKVKSSWEVAAKDLDHVAQVGIQVEHDGIAVAAGEVQIDDGLKRDAEILDSKSAGNAMFFDVKPGRVLATVRVKADKGGTDEVTQVVQCPLSRDKILPIFTIAIAQAVDTVAANPTLAKPASNANPASVAATPAPPSALGLVLTYLVALVLAGGVIYGFIHYFKKSPGTVSEKLEQLGVQIPKPGDQGAMGGASVPISLPKPEPPQKILLDDAAPIPFSVPIPTSASIGSVSQEPSLLSSAGISIPIGQGETVVGRDAGLGLSLTGETTVSRNHATIHRQGAEVTVNDLGSTNGTFVNGARLQSPAILRPGDTVQFGSVAFRYQG